MRGFDEEERERIREELMAAGRDLFARYGPRKTTIADLTDAVGIANGTFYRFFDSKEELYFEVVQREGHELADELVANSLAAEDDPERAIRRFLRLLVETMEENELFQQLLEGDELARMMRTMDGLSDEELEARRAASFAYVLPYVERWQEAGKIRDGDPYAIVGAMGVVKFLPLYREQFGEYYPAVRDTLIETVAAGLTRPPE
ncbi:TetR/AcrR family transcriptional regulator [Haladaptatus salinisoli]|uniref:TetR/AcrR family transcriptional regulator n=1 Tax=Haladaptatus salinisoli TaxID=2884876 RepID=UPI001D09FDF9|nr:TetR/AcrR family transcriptional regulator [Haladaptatus salinisoli]